MPVFELKNLKEAGGEETVRFQASLYIDGKRAAIVSNGGTGGSHSWSWFDPNLKVIFYDHIKTLADQGHFEFTLENDDSFIDELIEDIQMRKLCKKKTVFRLGTETGTEIYIMNLPYSASVRSLLVKEHGDRISEILNEKYLDEDAEAIKQATIAKR